MRNNYLISYDPNKNKWQSIVNCAELHAADRHIKVFDGAIIIGTYSSTKKHILDSLVSSGFSDFLITPADKGIMDGVLNGNDWDYIKRNLW